jgi:hypothetical protein
MVGSGFKAILEPVRLETGLLLAKRLEHCKAEIARRS